MVFPFFVISLQYQKFIKAKIDMYSEIKSINFKINALEKEREELEYALQTKANAILKEVREIKGWEILVTSPHYHATKHLCRHFDYFASNCRIEIYNNMIHWVKVFSDGDETTVLSLRMDMTPQEQVLLAKQDKERQKENDYQKTKERDLKLYEEIKAKYNL